ncbi:MAG TPA: hypothetical protein DIT93_04770 [Pelagibacterium sp.]|nr:hypothetical protein [Pelagibacterium sp.]HCO54316.1 hypothetical protein [Pelagibacterium sp.]|tara:strand:- start:27 stop:461 length:435 start_codon:yes stop_codon:yes gene_type:complete
MRAQKAALAFCAFAVKALGSEWRESVGMGLARDIGTEIIKALAVLAVVFLSFAHQPIVLDVPDDGFSVSVADLSFCGGAPDEDGSGHAPCHACRAGIADLPPVPCVSEPAYARFTRARFTLADDLVVEQHPFSIHKSRAPPALA